jgi:hypothetical protein
VDHEAQVRPVDAHAEGGRRHHHLGVAVHEPLLGGGPLLGPAASVVVLDHPAGLRRQELGQLLGLPPGGHVDDAVTVERPHRLHQRRTLVPLLVEGADLQRDVWAVEALDDHGRVPEPQALHDLLPHHRRGGGGESHHRRVPEVVDRRAQPEVVRAEVVAPLRDAVGLVDHEQAGRRRLQGGPGLVVAQLLGGHEEELELAAGQALEGPPSAPLAHRGVDGGGGPDVVVLLERLDLVGLEGDEGRDDDGRARDQRGGHLVHGRLARACGHDEQRVPALEHGGGGLALAGAQLVDAEALACDPSDAVDGARHRPALPNWRLG